MKRKHTNPDAITPLPGVEYDPNSIGYVRVSTEDQTADMQITSLMRAGVHPTMIYQDIGVSGAALHKEGRELALRACRDGMTLVVWKLDRVSRDLLDLLHLLQDMERRNIGFRSLNESIDTKTPMGKVMLAVLGAFAQFERDTARQRTMAGIADAKERGVKFGQPTKITDSVRKIVEDTIKGGGSVKQAAKNARIAVSTVRKHWKSDALRKLRRSVKSKKSR